MQSELKLPQVKQILDYTCGAACFESMFRYVTGQSLGELHFANQLGTLERGYTSPEKVVELAKMYGLNVEMIRAASFENLGQAFQNRSVIFVTWWDEDAGHYSLVENITETEITLMDPWSAREGKNNTLAWQEFETYWQQRGGVMISVSVTAPIPILENSYENSENSKSVRSF